jgi:hypothetical protein
MYAQTTQENLEKYWLYRDRLRKHFIVISPHDEFGTNIPFFYHSFYWKEGNIDRRGLTIGDGNDGLQYYIGMLATEYALSQKYNMDVTQTRNELLYALKAVERLDKYAECQFRQLPNIKKNSEDNTGTNINEIYTQIPNTNQYKDGDLNGFFIRDDIGKDFIDRYPHLKPYNTVRSTFIEGQGRNMPYEQSQDNVWNYLVNLALVYILVDDAEIKKKTQDIAYRMITYMHSNVTNEVYYPCGLFSGCFPGEWRTITTPTWKITNPVTGFEVVDGARIEELTTLPNGTPLPCTDVIGFNYGFAEAGNFITNKNLHYSCSQDQGRENWFYTHVGFATWKSRIPHATLATVGGNNTIYSNYASGTIMQALFASLFQDIGKCPSQLEHLPLIRKLIVDYQMKQGMYDNYEDLQVFNEFKNSRNLLAFYENLLNEAPICGPVNDGPGKYRVINWSVDNRLTNSGQIKELDPIESDPYRVKIDNGFNNGTYNGIDYMLLHNLYWLCFAPPSEPFTVNCTNYSPNIHTRNIVSNCTIPANKTITYTASESISLQPGFSAQKGSTFKAEINTQWRYQYTNPAELISSNNCYSGIPYSLQKSESITSEIYNEISPYTYPSEIVDLPLYAIMPNPNTGSFTIKNIQQKNFNIQIYSMSGVLLTQHQSYGNDIPISIEQKGIFQLQITSENKVYTEQIICK